MKIIIFSLFFAFSALCIAEPLPEGHPTVQQALGTPAENAGGNALLNQGTVTSVLQTEHYTYLEVENAGVKQWLAVTNLTVAEGAVIRYENGVGMTDFFSQSLKREFPSILFIASVKIVSE